MSILFLLLNNACFPGWLDDNGAWLAVSYAPLLLACLCILHGPAQPGSLHFQNESLPLQSKACKGRCHACDMYSAG